MSSIQNGEAKIMEKHKRHKKQVTFYKKKHTKSINIANVLMEKLTKVKTSQEEILENFFDGNAETLMKQIKQHLHSICLFISGLYFYGNINYPRQIRELRNIPKEHKKEKIFTSSPDSLCCLSTLYLCNNSYLKFNHSNFSIIQCGHSKCSILEVFNEICDNPFIFQESIDRALFVTSDGLFVLFVKFIPRVNGSYEFYIYLYHNNRTFDFIMGIASLYRGVIRHNEKIKFILNQNNILVIENPKLLIKYNMTDISSHIKFASIIVPGIGQPGTFNQFLMKGLYDPRLLVLIWYFAFENNRAQR